MSLHILRRLSVPFLLMLAALFLRERVDQLDLVYQPLLPWLPYVTLGLCLALAAYFNRARIFTTSLGCLAAYYLIQMELQVSLAETRPLMIYSMLSLAVPLTLCCMLFLPERGLRNRYGLLLVLIIPLQWGIAGWALTTSPDSVLLCLQNWMMTKPFSGYILSLFASALFIVGFALALYCLCRRDSDNALMVLTVFMFSFVTLAFLDQADISLTMFSALGVGLIIGMLNSSYDMAYRDELTGLLARRAFNDRLKALGRRYVIAMMDVDHFKKFNDTYGHDVGDEVLKMVAAHIAAVKGGGKTYRYGGEEFSIVFPGKDIEYCLPFLEDVRQAIEGYSMRLRDSQHRPDSKKEAKQRRGRRTKSRGETQVSVTISIGLAERNENNTKPDEVLKAADAALYRAKKKGRNCVMY